MPALLPALTEDSVKTIIFIINAFRCGSAYPYYPLTQTQLREFDRCIVMPWMNTPTHFGRAAQLFHWLTVKAVGVAWLIGQSRDEFSQGLVRQEAGFIHTYAR